ncbi:hypothetical protein HK405_011538, partial [Cladochytrium tenue]
MGGSSSTNAMLYVRCSPEDYNEWESLHGCRGWGWDNVLPYMKKSESCQISGDIVERDMHGHSGPLKISPTSGGAVLPISKVFIKACAEIGVGEGPDNGVSGSRASYADKPYGSDYNGRNPFGAGLTQSNVYNGIRQSTYRAFILPLVDPASRSYRTNLTVLVGHQAVRLEVDPEPDADGQRRVAGVVLQTARGAAPLVVRANREVVLAGGTIGSPTLLLHSGIGPRADIEEHGIPLVADVPGVGQNLQDHLVIGIRHRDPSSSTYRASLGHIVGGLTRYTLFKSGLLTTCGIEAMAFLNAGKDEESQRKGPNFQIHFMAANIDPPLSTGFLSETIIHSPIDPRRPDAFIRDEAYAETKRQLTKPLPFYVFNQLATLLHPYSRGTVTLASPDPFIHPTIDPAYLSDARDVRVLVEGARVCRRVADSMRAVDRRFVGDEVLDESLVHEIARIRGWRPEEVKTGSPKWREAGDSDEYLEQMVRRSALTLYHPVGTCKMGDPSQDESVVVDASNLKLRGFANLRIADASVIPVVTSGNTNAPAILVGEVCADMIRGKFPQAAAAR